MTAVTVPRSGKRHAGSDQHDRAHGKSDVPALGPVAGFVGDLPHERRQLVRRNRLIHDPHHDRRQADEEEPDSQRSG
jgi:hypothetical protein